FYARKVHEFVHQNISVDKSNKHIYSKLGISTRSIEFFIAFLPFLYKYVFTRYGEITDEVQSSYDRLKSILKKNSENLLNSIIRDIDIIMRGFLSKWLDNVGTSPSIVVVRMTRYLEQLHESLVSVMILQDISVIIISYHLVYIFSKHQLLSPKIF
ncbi:hypothetical protein MXB_2491, partial [Myxobolus squamalis]